MKLNFFGRIFLVGSLFSFLCAVGVAPAAATEFQVTNGAFKVGNLEVTGPTATGTSFKAGDKIVLSVTVKNYGFKAPFEARLEIKSPNGDVVYNSRDAKDAPGRRFRLDRNADFSFTCPLDAPSAVGTYTYRLRVRNVYSNVWQLREPSGDVWGPLFEVTTGAGVGGETAPARLVLTALPPQVQAGNELKFQLTGGNLPAQTTGLDVEALTAAGVRMAFVLEHASAEMIQFRGTIPANTPPGTYDAHAMSDKTILANVHFEVISAPAVIPNTPPRIISVSAEANGVTYEQGKTITGVGPLEVTFKIEAEDTDGIVAWQFDPGTPGSKLENAAGPSGTGPQKFTIKFAYAEGSYSPDFSVKDGSTQEKDRITEIKNAFKIEVTKAIQIDTTPLSLSATPDKVKAGNQVKFHLTGGAVRMGTADAAKVAITGPGGFAMGPLDPKEKNKEQIQFEVDIPENAAAGAYKAVAMGAEAVFTVEAKEKQKTADEIALDSYPELKPFLKDGKVTICHHPEGNVENVQTITIAPSAWEAHKAHGDELGPCKAVVFTDTKLKVTPDKVEAGQEITAVASGKAVEALLANWKALGVTDEAILATAANITVLKAGTTDFVFSGHATSRTDKEITFKVTVPKWVTTGEYDVMFGVAKDKFTVKGPEVFTDTKMKVSPDKVDAGQQVTVEVTGKAIEAWVKANGGPANASKSNQAMLFLVKPNNTSQMLPVSASEVTDNKVTFTIMTTDSPAGTYKVMAMGAPDGSFEVVAAKAITDTKIEVKPDKVDAGKEIRFKVSGQAIKNFVAHATGATLEPADIALISGPQFPQTSVKPTTIMSNGEFMEYVFVVPATAPGGTYSVYALGAKASFEVKAAPEDPDSAALKKFPELLPFLKDGKVTICHHPEGHPENMQTITIAPSAWEAHKAHGDELGECKKPVAIKYSNLTVTPADAFAPATLGIGVTREAPSVPTSGDMQAAFAAELKSIADNTKITDPNGSAIPLGDGGKFFITGDQKSAYSHIELKADATPGEYTVKVFDLTAKFKIGAANDVTCDINPGTVKQGGTVKVKLGGGPIIKTSGGPQNLSSMVLQVIGAGAKIIAEAPGPDPAMREFTVPKDAPAGAYILRLVSDHVFLPHSQTRASIDLKCNLTVEAIVVVPPVKTLIVEPNVPWVELSGAPAGVKVKVKGYGKDKTDGSEVSWNSLWPNLSYDDDPTRRDSPNAVWTGSYSFSGNVLTLNIQNLTAPYPPAHNDGIGYMVALEGAKFEDGSVQKTFEMYTYAGVPGQKSATINIPLIVPGGGGAVESGLPENSLVALPDHGHAGKEIMFEWRGKNLTQALGGEDAIKSQGVFVCSSGPGGKMICAQFVSSNPEMVKYRAEIPADAPEGEYTATVKRGQTAVAPAITTKFHVVRDSEDHGGGREFKVEPDKMVLSTVNKVEGTFDGRTIPIKGDLKKGDAITFTFTDAPEWKFEVGKDFDMEWSADAYPFKMKIAGSVAETPEGATITFTKWSVKYIDAQSMDRYELNTTIQGPRQQKTSFKLVVMPGEELETD